MILIFQLIAIWVFNRSATMNDNLDYLKWVQMIDSLDAYGRKFTKYPQITKEMRSILYIYQVRGL